MSWKITNGNVFGDWTTDESSVKTKPANWNSVHKDVANDLRWKGGAFNP